MIPGVTHYLQTLVGISLRPTPHLKDLRKSVNQKVSVTTIFLKKLMLHHPWSKLGHVFCHQKTLFISFIQARRKILKQERGNMFQDTIKLVVSHLKTTLCCTNMSGFFISHRVFSAMIQMKAS